MFARRQVTRIGERKAPVHALAVSDRFDNATTDSDRASQAITAYASTAADDPRRALLRERAIEAWLPLAQHLTRRYTGRGEPADDLFQVAVVGLIKAVDRFEADRGVEFAGFAIPTIVGEIKRHFRDRTWSVRVPRRLQELRMSITAANNELTHTLGRSPTVADVAAHLGITEEEVLEGLEGSRAYAATSLSTPVDQDGRMELADTLGGTDHGFELTELRVALGPALAAMDERQRTILSLRFYGNLTQSEIGEKLGISQMHVSRLLSKALEQLRGQLYGDTVPPRAARRRRPATA
jgi:RNA polymerase sigma-B factor